MTSLHVSGPLRTEGIGDTEARWSGPSARRSLLADCENARWSATAPCSIWTPVLDMLFATLILGRL
jgi:hypothetical protein